MDDRNIKNESQWTMRQLRRHTCSTQLQFSITDELMAVWHAVTDDKTKEKERVVKKAGAGRAS